MFYNMVHSGEAQKLTLESHAVGDIVEDLVSYDGVAAKHSAMHDRSPTNKKLSDPKCQYCQY